MAAEPTAWQAQRERGNTVGPLILLWAARHLGRRLALVMLFFVTLYFFLTGRAARAASHDYLSRVLGKAPGWLARWRHVWCFAITALDRVFLLSGSPAVRVEIDQTAMVMDAAQRGGALLIVSHFGSFEAMRAPGVREAALPLSIVLDRAHGARFNAVMERAAPQFAAQVIDAAQPGPALVLQIREALAAGRLVGLMADRARPGEATVAVDFLGAPAAFPLGPWQLALALRCPVILGFAAYQGGGRYRAHFELLPLDATAGRGARTAIAADAAARYAARLAEQLRAAPYNWGNFYPFWLP
jgi:predicted LPLAT superfamily acyltransferase